MYFDDTTTEITITGFDEDRIQLLDGNQRLQYFADDYSSAPVLKPMGKKRCSILKRLGGILKK